MSGPLIYKKGLFGGEWTPNDLGLYVWHDYSNVGSITKDGSNLISQINDLSGNSRHGTQSTAGNKPLYLSNTKNGLSVAHFCRDSSTPGWVNFSASLSQPFTFVVAFRMIGTGTNFPTFMDQTGGGINIYRSSSNWIFNSGSTPSYGALFTNGNYYVLIWYLNNTANSVWLDGTQKTGNASGTNALANFLFGANRSPATANSVEFYACEFFIVTKAISSEERQQVETYLNDKWAIY